MPDHPLEILAAEARSCIICAEKLPLGPRPVFRVSATARLLIISQAPGTKVHETGIPWNDASGDRLPNGGDRPPRPECAPAWHERFLRLMPAVALTLLIGSYAQTRYLGPGSMTARVKNFAAAPKFFALPHPSWRTIGWEAKNPWFAAEVLPALRTAVMSL
jgi:uracil-DNA glycosylase